MRPVDHIGAYNLDFESHFILIRNLSKVLEKQKPQYMNSINKQIIENNQRRRKHFGVAVDEINHNPGVVDFSLLFG